MAAKGSSWVSRPGNAATNEMTRGRTSPAGALRWWMTAWVTRWSASPPRTTSMVVAAPVSGTIAGVAMASGSGLPGPRVEHRCGQVGKKDADEHGHGVEQEESLLEAQVVQLRAGDEEVADTGVG